MIPIEFFLSLVFLWLILLALHAARTPPSNDTEQEQDEDAMWAVKSHTTMLQWFKDEDDDLPWAEEVHEQSINKEKL